MIHLSFDSLLYTSLQYWSETFLLNSLKISSFFWKLLPTNTIKGGGSVQDYQNCGKVCQGYNILLSSLHFQMYYELDTVQLLLHSGLFEPGLAKVRG